MTTTINQPILYDTVKGYYNFAGGPSGNLGIIMEKTNDAGTGKAYIEVNNTNGIRLLLSAGGTNYVYLESASGSWSSFSDQRLKNIIDNISDSLTKLKSLRTIRFCYKNDSCNNCSPTDFDIVKNLYIYNCECTDKRIRHGLIAQDVQAIYPELVQETDYLSMSLESMVPLITSGIQELNTNLIENNTKIITLQSKITEAINRLNILENL